MRVTLTLFYLNKGKENPELPRLLVNSIFFNFIRIFILPLPSRLSHVLWKATTDSRSLIHIFILTRFFTVYINFAGTKAHLETV